MSAAHILVAEDYDRFRQFVCALLEQSGSFQISQAADGMEAVQKFQELAPDLILLDIGLPELNGLDVARMVGTASKVLFLSQEYSADIVDEALGLGAGYVYKADVQSELLTAIEAIRQGRQYVSSSLESLERSPSVPIPQAAGNRF